MWLVVLFDLSTNTSGARRSYRKFVDLLRVSGFFRVQYSVYQRYCRTIDHATSIENKVKEFLPSEGDIRILCLTDIQQKRLQAFKGKARVSTETVPEQLVLL